MNHKEWYQQRYQQAVKKKPLSESKMIEYQQLNQLKKDRQIQLEESAKIIFQEHNISYTPQGHVWLCDVNGSLIYYYPKSAKWRPKGGSTTYNSRGALDFLGKVWRYQNQS